MIHKVVDTSGLEGVYFDDTDELVGTREECYLVQAWYFHYFSTLESAKEKAQKLGLSQEVKE